MSNLRPRVIVTVPGAKPYVRHGERRGEFDNGRGRWVSVMLDGHRTVSWFWHEYVALA